MIIYKFSLKENIAITPEIRDKIKLMAYLVYSELVDYGSEIGKNILFNDNIIFNELYDGFRERINRYEFEHDDYYKGIYEPFMINDTTFGFTINDNTITDNELMIIINEVKGIIRFKWNFDIEKIALLNNEERMITISSFYGNNDSMEPTPKKLTRNKNS